MCLNLSLRFHEGLHKLIEKRFSRWLRHGLETRIENELRKNLVPNRANADFWMFAEHLKKRVLLLLLRIFSRLVLRIVIVVFVTRSSHFGPLLSARLCFRTRDICRRLLRWLRFRRRLPRSIQLRADFNDGFWRVPHALLGPRVEEVRLSRLQLH